MLEMMLKAHKNDFGFFVLAKFTPKWSKDHDSRRGGGGNNKVGHPH